jgi:hypothetical protein
MVETRQFECIVTDNTDDSVWVKLREGEKAGLQFAIKKKCTEYTEVEYERIDGLEKDDLLEASFVSLNPPRNTAWRFGDVDIIETPW